MCRYRRPKFRGMLNAKNGGSVVKSVIFMNIVLHSGTVLLPQHELFCLNKDQNIRDFQTTNWSCLSVSGSAVVNFSSLFLR